MREHDPLPEWSGGSTRRKRIVTTEIGASPDWIVELLFLLKGKLLSERLTLEKHVRQISSVKCVFIRPIKLVTFQRKKGETPNRLLVFFHIDIVDDFVEIFHNNNNDTLLKSSKILRMTPRTLKISEDFAFVMFSFFSLFLFDF